VTKGKWGGGRGGNERGADLTWKELKRLSFAGEKDLGGEEVEKASKGLMGHAQSIKTATGTASGKRPKEAYIKSDHAEEENKCKERATGRGRIHNN